MNLGFYLPQLENTVVKAAVDEIQRGFDADIIRDASIFFDNVGPTERQNVCGMFDSTNLWNFEGTLIVVSPDNLQKARSISNKHKIIYYAGLVKINILHLLPFLTEDVRCIASTAEQSVNFTRLTGRQTEAYFPNFEGICKYLGEYPNE